VVDVDLDGAAGAVAELQIFEEALTQGSQGNPRGDDGDTGQGDNVLEVCARIGSGASR
jgi:hypothetical protein